MIKRVLLCMVLSAVASVSFPQSVYGVARLVFAGDLMGHMPLHRAARQADGSYNYEPVFRYLKPYIESADLAVVNLEVTLAGEPYTGYPCFSAPDALAGDAFSAGFDIFATANNHCADKGARGLRRTIAQLDAIGARHLGTYIDTASRSLNHPLFVECNGIRIALLCYTYGTNGITVPSPMYVNMIDTVAIKQDLIVAKQHKVDFVIAFVHWGVEYQKHHNPQQESLARWLISHGVGAVIGSHPHVVQDFTSNCIADNIRGNDVVVYSLGNFVSNQHDPGTDGGILVELTLGKKWVKTEVVDCGYLPFWVHRASVNGKLEYHLVPSTDAIEYPDSYGLSHNDIKKVTSFAENLNLLFAPELESASQTMHFREVRFFRNGRPDAVPYRSSSQSRYFPSISIPGKVWLKKVCYCF